MSTIPSKTTSLRGALCAVVLPCVLALAACSHGTDNNAAPAPSITLSVQPTTIGLGESAQLSWMVTAGASCTATDGWTGSEPAAGTQTVTPATLGNVNYTLTCHVPSGAYSAGSADSAKTVTLSVTPQNAFTNTALAADTTSALVLDPRLVNPWGVAMSSTSTAWVANAGTDTATLYDGNGRAQPAANPRTVTLPAGAGGAPFEPTGIVANSSADFVIATATTSAPAKFLFAGKRGGLAGWSPVVDANHAIDMYDDPASMYTGLAIASDGANQLLYAADFRNGRVDVFDAEFAKQAVSATQFAFADPDLPTGYAPFGIQALNTGPSDAPEIYVTYAQRSELNDRDSVSGAGLGRVDVYSLNGELLKQLIGEGGMLDAPWSVALAPPNFGRASDRLLVSNFGDGRINVFGTLTGQFASTLSDSRGVPITLPGLRGIAFGNGVNNQPINALFYAAGTNGGLNGTFGRIDLGATPPLLNQPPVVVVSSPTSGQVTATVPVTATVQSSIAIAKVDFLVGTTLFETDDIAPFAVQWDTTAFGNGTVLLRAIATDVDGNVGTSAEVPVTIANGASGATLARIQAEVFTPLCSGCHNGSNPPTGALPGAQNLTTGNAFANLVGVPSKEIPALLRVKPNDPGNSYLIRKLEGSAGIQGGRMPLGGQPLDQATIDIVKAWITSGAPNN